MSNMNRPITERRYYAVILSLASPICVRSGKNDLTDMDILRNRRGEPFIPGSTFAGAFRERLSKGKKESCLFGYSDGEKGCMSSVLISDFYFFTDTVISVRDGVQLKPDKSVEDKSKFDAEIIETGAKGVLYISYIQREQDPEDWDFPQQTADILNALHQGEIRIGARKNRGYGRFQVEEVRERTFAEKDLKEWIRFVPERKDLKAYGAPSPFSDWIRDSKDSFHAKYISVEVPLRLTGGLSIRRYSTMPGKADYEQLTCNGKPVIPGSSWNGAIRSDALRILKELNCQHAEELIQEWFGYVDQSKKAAKQSCVAFEESILKGSVPVSITRNQVSRFSAATKHGALYSEVTAAQGTTMLKIHIRKDKDDYKALLGLLMLVVKDLENGMLPVGGLSSVGRGIFAQCEDRSVEISGDITEEECLHALYDVVMGEKK